MKTNQPKRGLRGPRKDDGCECPLKGQNPIWPGEKTLTPGEIDDKKRNEKTRIPRIQ